MQFIMILSVFLFTGFRLFYIICIWKFVYGIDNADWKNVSAFCECPLLRVWCKHCNKIIHEIFSLISKLIRIMKNIYENVLNNMMMTHTICHLSEENLKFLPKDWYPFLGRGIFVFVYRMGKTYTPLFLAHFHFQYDRDSLGKVYFVFPWHLNVPNNILLKQKKNSN